MNSVTQNLLLGIYKEIGPLPKKPKKAKKTKKTKK